jgi:uncharacterized protein YutD
LDPTIDQVLVKGAFKLDEATSKNEQDVYTVHVGLSIAKFAFCWFPACHYLVFRRHSQKIKSFDLEIPNPSR